MGMGTAKDAFFLGPAYSLQLLMAKPRRLKRMADDNCPKACPGPYLYKVTSPAYRVHNREAMLTCCKHHMGIYNFIICLRGQS